MAKGIIDEALYYLGELETARRDVHTASWTGGAVSGTGTNVTGTISLEPGVWLIVGQVPVQSANAAFRLQNLLSGKYFYSSHNYTTFTAIVTVSAVTVTRLQLAQAASVTFSQFDRGSLTAVRLA